MVRIFALALLFLCGSSSLAQRQTWAAPWDAYFLPLGYQPSSGCVVDASFRIANYLSFDEGTWGSINTDLEVWTLRLGIAQRTQIGEWSASLPLSLAWGGILDPPLNAFHRLLGVGVSPEPPLSEIRYNLTGGSARTVSGTRFGVGDLSLAWAYPLEPFWVRVTLGIPLGDSNRFLGAGGWRVQFSAGLEQARYGGLFALLVPLGRVELFEPFGALPSVQAQAWVQPFYIPVRLELHLNTSPVRVGGQFASTTLALRVVWQTSAGAWTFGEDITPTLPDIVLGWEGRFGC
ncbi:MAG: hypothetical protein ACK41E_12305 [Deinococcales bacterium]